ncbi:MAG: hypothetical protein IJR20_02535 [Muribaculaceae bacterium]|nr:hypothetical protein [Muribaculaceae bacterium]
MITTKDFKGVEGIIDWLDEVPYDVTRDSLYNAHDLYQGYEPSSDVQADKSSYSNSYDGRTYQYYLMMGKNAENVNEALARTLHDHRIHIALNAFLANHNGRRCVGVMGGHAMLRTDPKYADIVMLSKRLTEEGFYMLTGGGPGAMEATHLGAWMAGRTREEVNEALKMLAVAPSFKDEGWLASAFSVIGRYPQSKYVSLGVSTWLYGHEPSTPFATHIAKFFENSIREDSILTMAFGGIIYTPGSAGTMQEIFQDAVQNHYLSFGFASPMIFWGKKFWTEEMPVYPLLQQLLKAGKYKNLILSITDDSREIEASLKSFLESAPSQ